MCGINGIVRLNDQAPPIDLNELRRTRDQMTTRGPDGQGEWLSPDGTVALGHRRLAILDLSPAGAQPKADPTNRYRIVFNGEIYNFRDLRAEQERQGDRFTTQSDTEVILALWAREGERCLSRLRGMYAFAIHDAVERSLTLVRDPFGIKPLYYEQRGDGQLRFASQVKALEAGGASKEVDPGGVAGFLLWGSVPEPWTIRRAIRALPAGHVLVVKEGTIGEPHPALAPPAESESTSVSEALLASVRAHLVSDVPVAIFLSSGLDSALITALAVSERRANGIREPVSTFTVSFAGWEGTARDEAPLAARVASALGTLHVERRLTRDDVARAWPAALAAMDQPSIDGFNTFVVARAAHEAGIKVALSGLGGDELFGSYPSFRDVPRWARRARQLAAIPGANLLWPPVARAFARDRPKLQGLASQGRSLAGAYHLRRGLFLPRELPGILGFERARQGLAAHDPVRYAEEMMQRSSPFTGNFAGSGEGENAARDWRTVQRLEQSLYMRNQLLRDSDWAAMASSLELRMPLVDVPLWRAAARAGFEPARSRGRAGFAHEVATALVLGLPEELWRRPKTGFAVPVAEWMVPPRRTARDTAGKGSRRIALKVLEELGVP